jgi:hypothetical protein
MIEKANTDRCIRCGFTLTEYEKRHFNGLCQDCGGELGSDWVDDD